jgi:thiosulfate dehydrogenase (quinone) large subunit
MRLTRTGMYVLTAISAALYALLLIVFSDPWYDKFTLTTHLWSEKAADNVKVWVDGTLWTYVLLAVIIAAGIWQAQRIPAEGVDVHTGKDATVSGQVDDPKGWQLLMGNTWLAMLWLPLRFYIGMAFLSAGAHKIIGNQFGSGASLKGYWTAAVGTADKPGKAYYSWYHDFLQYMLNHHWYTWFADLVMWGEFLVGVGLIVGALVGIAAFFGTLLNFNFLMAGTTSTNPVLFGLGIFLVLGWKVAGYLGLDRYLLPALGAPWAPGRLVRREHYPSTPAHPTPHGGHAD